MKRQFVFLLFLMMIGALLEAGGIGIIYPILDITINGVSNDLTGLSMWALDFSERLFPGNSVVGLYWLTFFIYLFKNVYLVAMNYYQLHFSWKNRAEIASKLFRFYLANPYEFHIQRNSSVLLRNVTIGISEMMVKVVLPTIILLTEFFVIGVVAFMLASISPRETAFALVSVCLFSGLYYLAIRHRILQWGKKAFAASGVMIATVNQGLGGIKATKVYGAADFFTDTFTRAITRQSVMQKRMGLAGMLPRYILETILVGGVLLTIIIISPNGKAGTGLIPVMGMIGMAAFRLLPSFNRISGSLTVMRGALPIIDRVHDDIVSAEQPIHSKHRTNFEKMPFEHGIKVENLSFTFENSDAKILSDINLTIQRNECVAFVGASGAGKTTLADCILGLLKPSQGDITVDGVSIGDSLAGWQKQIGYIPQDIFLTDDTLRRNIAYGFDDADINEASVLRAVEEAQLFETVAGMPDGLDTRVGERGVSLSGGQRQRVGIARALYRDASLLILDEATSALDGKTEADIIKGMDSLQNDKCIIIIAHRLSTVRHCDRLYFMENGRIVDAGTFDDLKERNDEFRRMVSYMEFKDIQGNAT